MLDTKCQGIGQVVIPDSYLGPDPRDIKKSITRTTNLAEHPCPSIQGHQSKILESVLDIAQAANYKVPLIPQGSPNIPPATQAPTQLAQSFGTPIMSEHESRHTFFPKVLTKKPKTKEFSFPLGAFMEIKRQLVSKGIAPADPISKPPPPPPLPKPTHAIPKQPIPENCTGSKQDSHKHAIQEKTPENHTSRMEERERCTLPERKYDSERGKGKGKWKKQTFCYSLYSPCESSEPSTSTCCVPFCFWVSGCLFPGFTGRLFCD